MICELCSCICWDDVEHLPNAYLCDLNLELVSGLRAVAAPTNKRLKTSNLLFVLLKLIQQLRGPKISLET